MARPPRKAFKAVEKYCIKNIDRGCTGCPLNKGWYGKLCRPMPYLWHTEVFEKEEGEDHDK